MYWFDIKVNQREGVWTGERSTRIEVTTQPHGQSSNIYSALTLIMEMTIVMMMMMVVIILLHNLTFNMYVYIFQESFYLEKSETPSKGETMATRFPLKMSPGRN